MNHLIISCRWNSHHAEYRVTTVRIVDGVRTMSVSWLSENLAERIVPKLCRKYGINDFGALWTNGIVVAEIGGGI